MRKITRAIVAVATVAVMTSALLVQAGTAAVAADVLPGVAPLEQRNPMTATADALPTVQIDSGVVWTQVMRGNVVYAGGSFSQTRPAGAAPGTNLTPRSNLLAFDVRNGQLLPFAPEINGTVKSLALSPDGATLYVGGSFTKVGTTTRFNVAAFDTATGALSATFKPAIGGAYVNGIVATSDVVYFGGLIGAAGGQPRTNFAAANVSGQVLGWAPTSDLQVDSMVLAPDGGKVIAAGRFASVNGVTQRGLAALDLNNGALLPWNVANVVKNGRNDGSGNSGKAGIWALAADSKNVYGTGWVFADVPTGNLEGMFAADTAQGDVVWIADCHGDHYGIFSDGVNVYSTGHEHECTTAGGLPQGNGTMRNATVYTAAAKGTLTRSPYVNSIYADWSGWPAPAAVNWFPDWLTGTATGMGQAGWTITGNSDFVVVGGEFVGVNNQRQQGLVRFARAPQGGAKQGPMVSGSSWTPTGRSLLGGTVDIVIPSNWDRDDRDLTYELWEDGASAPAATAQGASTFWNTPDVRLRASGLQPGSIHTFRVRTKDGDGNTATSAPATVTVTSTPPSAYATEVLDGEPSLYWRFSQPDPKADWAGTNTAVTRSGYTASSDSAIAGEVGSASFNGTKQGFAVTPKTVATTSEYSLELWFKAGRNVTGKLIGYGNSATGDSSSYDRHVYLTSTGRIVFGTYPGATRTVFSPSGVEYNDGAWHHVVASQTAGGMALYIDGALAGTDPNASAQSYTGYWRIGGDNLGGWPNDPSNDYFAGRLDEVAVYPHALTAEQIERHHALGTGQQPPSAAFVTAGADLAWSFDASSSTSGSAASYSWDFGDGTAPRSGVTASHTYAEPGTYTVTLTVQDTRGLTDTETAVVTATAPHQRPTAVIDSTVDGLTAEFGSARSTATGGATIVAADWDFGDGTTSDELAPTHRFPRAGTFTVKLVVTDSLGSESTAATSQVTMSHADPIARFAAESSALTVNVDADESSASDAATMTYAWDWGDGTPDASGATAEHTYGEPGWYSVTLTVTDSFGASASVTQDVEVTGFLVQDDFERTVSTGWGDADVGGAWQGTTGLSVDGGEGHVTVNRSQTRQARLTGLDVADFDATAVFSLNKIADGGGIHLNLMGRKTDAGDYRAKLRISASGAVNVAIAQVAGTTETLLATRTLPGVTLTANAGISVRFAVATQGSSTSLKAKAWLDGAAQPSDWTATAVSSTAALQAAGDLVIGSYATGTVTNGPVVVSVDDLRLRGLDAPEHVAPTAVIDAEAAGLSVSYSAAASQTHDAATLTGYSWDFGDGKTSTEAAPSHAYAEPGTYQVRLTVTDSFGATSQPATKAVTVSHGAPTASFAAQVSGKSVSVDASASSAQSPASITKYTWEWGDGSAAGSGPQAQHSYASDDTYQITLTVTDSLGGTASTTRSVLISAEQFVARDDFSRDAASGWGTALVGGGWTGASGLSVVDGRGLMTLNRSQTRSAVLSQVAEADMDSTFSFSMDRVADGGGAHINYGVHRTSAGEYRAKLRISSTGVISAGVAKVVGGTETLVANRTVPSIAVSAGAAFSVRVTSVTSGGSTIVQVRVWPTGSQEPSAWAVTATDSEATLQAAGAISLSAYAAGTVTNGPIIIGYDDLVVR